MDAKSSPSGEDLDGVLLQAAASNLLASMALMSSV